MLAVANGASVKCVMRTLWVSTCKARAKEFVKMTQQNKIMYLDEARLIFGLKANDALTCKDDIRSVYQELIMKYHPDKGNGNVDMFQKVKEAYKVLTEEKHSQHVKVSIEIPPNIACDGGFMKYALCLKTCIDCKSSLSCIVCQGEDKNCKSCCGFSLKSNTCKKCKGEGVVKEKIFFNKYVKSNAKDVDGMSIVYARYDGYTWFIENNIMIVHVGATIEEYLCGFVREIVTPKGTYIFETHGAIDTNSPIMVFDHKTLIYVKVQEWGENVAKHLSKFANVFKKMFERL